MTSFRPIAFALVCLWLGAMIMLSVVAPAVFGVVGPSQAGQIMRRLFPLYYAASLGIPLLVEEARGFRGCQNRVSFVHARALLERARRKRASGGDPSGDLQEILAQESAPNARVRDNEPWKALFGAAREELRR